MKKSTAFILIAAILILALCSCGSSSDPNATKLSFKSASSYERLKELDGTTVTINGYMATSSPADGSFIFLMNLPYQSCPFCKPNTYQLSNTMEVYPKKNQKFDYTTQAIKVTGTLMVAPSEAESFSDPYGYEFNFKIVDADYVILKSEDLTAELALWQKIANSDVVNEIYLMYDYVYFLCAWNEYYVQSYTDADGTLVPGYYLYPSDALQFLTRDNAQYNYGYRDGYFDGIVRKLESMNGGDMLAGIISNVRSAETLATEALGELVNGNYKSEYKYVEMFGQSDYVYTLNMGDELKAKFDELYLEFADWLGNWEV